MLVNKGLQAAVLDTIGVNGLDSQTHPTALDPTWFTKADNIVYTEGGRVTFRKGLKQRTLAVSKPIGALIEHKITEKLFCAYNGTIAEVNLTTPDNAFSNPYTTGATDSHWQFVEYDDDIYGFQYNAKPVVYTNGVVTNPWTKVEEISGYSNPSGLSTFKPSCGLGQYGRMWAGGNVTDKNVLYYSELEAPHKWATGDSGYIDLKFVWEADEIIAIRAYAGKLVIFGRQNIAIYNNPWDVQNGLTLDEVIKGVGCVSRDSIQAVGNDLFFVSDTGVRSLKRTAEGNQDKLPLREMSITIKDELISNISNSSNIKSSYVLDEGLYIISFVDLNVTYVFDITYWTPRQTPRITKWYFEGDREPISLVYSETYGLLFGEKSGHICSYEEYYDADYEGSDIYKNNPFTGGFSTVWIDLGDGYVSSILKKLLLVISGGQGTNIGLRLYKDFELTASISSTFKMNPPLSGLPSYWGKSKFPSSTVPTNWDAYKYAPISGLKEVGVPLAGDAKYIRFEMDGVTNGYKSSLQSLSLLYKPGKIY